MAEFFLDYSAFLLKTATIVIAIVGCAIGIIVLATRGREALHGHLEIKNLNEKYQNMAVALEQHTLSKEVFKKAQQARKKQRKKQKADDSLKPKVYVLNFDGDIKASAVSSLTEEVTAVLLIAKPEDEVFLNLQSGGGLVHAYGLAASQLTRIKARNIPLTIGVDKIAASGGYMMACVADRIIAAPFAVIGAIGVVAQIPNFHRLLKKYDIDFEQFTAGEYKRTLTLFGENTDRGREKFKEELEDTHVLFKEFITEHRPQVSMEQVATGEHWPAKRALDLELVDELITSDDYLMSKAEHADIYEITYAAKRPWGVRLGWFIRHTVENVLSRDFNRSL